MALTVNRETLSQALTMAQTCVESKGTIPALAFAALEMKDGKLTIVATDLDVTFQTTIEAEGDNGAFCVPVKDVARLVSLFDGDVISIAPAEGRVIVACGKSRYKLPFLARDAYPNVQEVQGQPFIIKGSMLKTILERTVFCVSTEQSRWAMSGVLFETRGGKLHAVSTDQHRLALIKYPIPFSGEVSGIVPAKAVRSVIKTMNDDDPVSVTITDQDAKFQQANTVIRTRLVLGQFPKYDVIIPTERKHSITLSTNSDKLFKRAAIVAETISDTKSRAAIFSVSREGVELTSSHADAGEGIEFIAAPCETLNGEAVPLKFAMRYFTEVLALESEVNLAFDDNNSQFLVTPNGLREYEYKYVFMPCRI